MRHWKVSLCPDSRHSHLTCFERENVRLPKNKKLGLEFWRGWDVLLNDVSPGAKWDRGRGHLVSPTHLIESCVLPTV